MAFVGALVAAAPVQTAHEEQLRLEDLLQAVGRYVREYERSFSAVVSREHYLQRARSGGTEEVRRLRSEVALVAVGDANWFLFRDVYEVDGSAVRDRVDRLAALFMKPTTDLAMQAKRIAEESARYNLGAITRTVNTPTQALAFIRFESQSRSAFRLGGRTTIDGVETREVRFQETGMPRMILTRDAAAAVGRFWVVPDSGIVVRTELTISSASAAAVFTVNYARQQRLSLWVPIWMTESYELEGPGTTGGSGIEKFDNARMPSKLSIEGHATYTDFRQFSVDTTMIIR